MSINQFGNNIVYLISPYSELGHLDSYSRIYSRAFLEIGWQVVLIAPNEANTKEYLLSNKVSIDNFNFRGFDPTIRSNLSYEIFELQKSNKKK